MRTDSCIKEYAIYVAKVRKYAQNMKLEKAVNRAVDECIKEGILAEFLKAKKAEVIAVSIFEYDKEEEEKKLRKAEYEAGEREGKITGIIDTLIELKISDRDIIKKLQEKVGISEKEAKEYLKTYKNL